MHRGFKQRNTRKRDRPTSFRGYFLVLSHSVTNFTWIYLRQKRVFTFRILLNHVVNQNNEGTYFLNHSILILDIAGKFQKHPHVDFFSPIILVKNGVGQYSRKA